MKAPDIKMKPLRGNITLQSADRALDSLISRSRTRPTACSDTGASGAIIAVGRALSERVLHIPFPLHYGILWDTEWMRSI